MLQMLINCKGDFWCPEVSHICLTHQKCQDYGETYLIKEDERMLCDRAQNPSDPLDVAREGGQAFLEILAVAHICQDPVKPGNGRGLRFSCSICKPTYQLSGCMLTSILAWSKPSQLPGDCPLDLTPVMYL